MPALYVENVPEDLYTALRDRARANKTSISAEVLTLLAENVPTAAELRRRKDLFDRIRELRTKRPPSPKFVRSAEDPTREDRER